MSDATPKEPKAGTKGPGKDGDNSIVIKKYANRRLYNTATSSYVTLDYLADMVKSGEDFVVYDAKSGEDITHSVLTQIIFEEESKGQNLLPIQFLRQLIKYYGDSLENFVPSYLEMSMESFSRNQDNIREQLQDAFGATSNYKLFEDSIRNNMSLFQQAMKMFVPMNDLYTPTAPQTPASPAAPSKAEPEAKSDDIDELKAQMQALQRQLDRLSPND